MRLLSKTPSDSKTSYEWGVLWMLLSATMLSCSFFFLKINIASINYFFLLLLRFSIPLIVVTLIIILFRDWKAFKTTIGLQISRALCVVIAQYGFAYYISKNTLLNATVLLNAAPLFIPLIEWLFLKHKPGKSTIAGALISFFGVILILRPTASLFTPLSAVGLIAAVAQASSQILFGMRPKSQSVLSGLFYLFLLTSAFSLFVFLFAEEAEKLPDMNTVHGWLLLSVILMGFATLLNQYFRGLAYRCGRPSTLATFLYFSVFVSFCFDWFFFHNIPTFLSIMGSLLVLAGGFIKIYLRAHILKKRGK